MKTIKFLLLALVAGVSFGQVGIGTENPQAMLHIARSADTPGELIIEDVPIVPISDVKYILVYTENDSKVKRIEISSLLEQINTGTCPNLTNGNQYNLQFISDSSIPNPNNAIQITVSSVTKTFAFTSATINGNKYHYRYTNNTGQSMNLHNGFTANFSGLICQYN